MPLASLIAKAETLHEALPYIRRFHGRTFVVKYGGHAMIEPELKASFARDIVLMKYVGLNPVVVHGGGPQIDDVLAKMGIAPKRVSGMRITDDETMDVVEMVLGGKVNQEIVALVCRHGGRAVGLSGKDDQFVLCDKLASIAPEVGGASGAPVDPGRVGTIRTVNPDIVHRLIDGAFIPVIAPVGVDDEGRALNVNADTFAGKIAEALGAEKLILMTDVEGILDGEGKLLSSIAAPEVEPMIRDGVLRGGMLPKVECALDALAGGVRKVHVIDGRARHACLLEIFTDRGIGTEIVSRR